MSTMFSSFNPDDYNPVMEEPSIKGVLQCPHCGNNKHFLTLIQTSSCGSITTISDALLHAEWCGWNMIQCAECYHPLLDGGKWRTEKPTPPKRSKGDLLKSIPLEVLEALLREKEARTRCIRQG